MRRAHEHAPAAVGTQGGRGQQRRRYLAAMTGVTSGFAPGGGLWQSLQSCFCHASPMFTG